MHKELPGRIAYRIKGNGPALMMIHGFGEDGTIWDEVADLLGDAFQLIIPDLPGIGLSQQYLHPSDTSTLDEVAEDIWAILQSEGMEKCAMIGHSMGGYITLAFAEKYPDKLTGFGLVNSTAYADSTERITVRKKSAAFIRAQGSAKFVAQMIPGLYSDGYQKTNEIKVNEHIDRASCFHAEALARYQQMMMLRPDRAHVLENTKIPVLFIIGPEDKTVILNDSLRQSRLAKQVIVHCLPLTAHMGIKEDPEGTVRAIREFMCTQL